MIMLGYEISINSTDEYNEYKKRIIFKKIDY